MDIGFTGSQMGCNVIQREWLCILLKGLARRFEDITLHHGDCIGADTECHQIARRSRYKVHLHVPVSDLKRAFCDYNVCSSPVNYLDRNKEIVENSKLLIAVSKYPYEVLRSGTCSTIRHARKLGIGIIILYPKTIRVEDSKEGIIENMEPIWRWLDASGFLIEKEQCNAPQEEVV